MAKTETSKGNPAHHRMANAHLKASRERRWRAGQRRKQSRMAGAREHQLANQARRKAGQATPWQQACRDRAARRLVTCGDCRLVFQDGECPQCHGSLNLAQVHARNLKPEQLPAA